MVCDHIHQMWNYVDGTMWLTYIGRLVFPIFMFLMADSFHYTRNRKKLILRLFAGTMFMTVMNFIVQLIFPNQRVILMNNAFSSFLIATIYMLSYDMIKNGIKEKNAKKIINGTLLCLLPLLTSIPSYILTLSGVGLSPEAEAAAQQAGTLIQFPGPVIAASAIFSMVVPNLLNVEGGFLTVIMGVLFYVLRKWRWAQVLVLAAVAALSFSVQGSGSFQWMMVFAAVPMLLYNGEKGRSMKDFFYVFYPAHIYLLYIIATITSK
jgi:hypothetical protein